MTPNSARCPRSRVDRLGALAHQKVARAEQHPLCLLLFPLHRHEAHGRPLGRLADRLRVRRVVLLTLHEGLDIDRRDQPDLVAELADLAAPVMRARARLHRHHAVRLRGHKVQHLLPAQLPAERDRAVRPRAMHLKAALRQIDPDDANLVHGCLLLQVVSYNHHLGTLRCRREEASTPSDFATEPPRARSPPGSDVP